MPQNPLLICFVGVLAPLGVLAAMPGQAYATDDPRNSSFDERWRPVPGYDYFICGGVKLNVDDRSLQKDETSSDSKPQFLRGLRQQLREVENEILARDLAKARKKRGTVRIEEPVEGIIGTLPEPYAKPCIIGLDQCADK